MKKTLLAVALTAASFTAVADMSISGHANLKAGFLEDFQSGGVSAVQGNEDLTVGDANTSQSRFRIKSSTEANGVTYASSFEFGFTKGGIGNRVNEVTAGGSLGKISLGQGSLAGDGASENDFSGTYLLAGDLSSWELGGDLNDNASKDINREERIRYDAPAIGNLALAVSVNDSNGSDATFTTGAAASTVTVNKAAVSGNDTGNDVSVSASYNLANFAASVAMVSAEADDSDVVTASVAGKMSGFTAAVQLYTKEGAAGNDFEQTRVIVGYNPGPFSVSVDFQQTEDDNKTIEAETMGLNFVYRPAKGVELYAGARSAEANDGALDENAFLMGARVKF
jgi:hypothetical protein